MIEREVARMSTLSYVHGASSVPLLGETISQNVRRTARRFPDREALVVPYQRYRATYRQFVDQVDTVARGLLARNVAKGDRVGIWAPNRYEWVLVQYATAAIGAILVNINPAYRSHELEYALQQSGTSLLIHAQRFRSADYTVMVREVRSRCPELRATLTLEDDWKRLLDEARLKPTAALAEREALLQFDDPINIQYTSGTTGFPKGATLSHHNILNNGFFIGEGVRYTENDRVCIPVPFYHCFGMVLGNLACTTHGACMVIPGESYDAPTVLRTAEESSCQELWKFLPA
jgi:fatty-acyl-CoA synthase